MPHSYAEIPTPQEGESFERYTVRAHKALLKSCPDPDERNAVVKNSWRQARGELPGESIAAKAFGPEKYERSDDHCVFVEHETTDKEGKPRKYGLKELSKIVERHNHEIQEAGAFPSLTAHHTPDKGDPNGKDPDVLGFGSSYRLGMIGRDNPRWAIFQDEYHLKDAKVELSKKPYRSVELWTFKDGRQRFHPIAAVGAEAPRLLMPGKFTQAEFEGAQVEKYTVAAGAYPAGSNTALKEQFTLGGTTLQPGDIAAIMAALSQTPEFVFLRDLMEEDKSFAGGDEQPGDDMPLGDEEADPSAMADPLDDESDDFSPDDQDTDLDEPESDDEPPIDDEISDSLPEAPDEDEDDPTEKFTMPADAVSVEKFTALQKEHTAQVEKYTELNKSHEALIEKYTALHGRVAQMEKVSTDATRGAKIDELASRFPLVIDADEEKKACLYSQGGNMSDDEFAKHVGTIEKYGEKFSNSPMVPRGQLPEQYTRRNSAEVEKYEQRLAEEAIKVHGEAQKSGKHLNWSECEAEAQKRIKSNGHATAAA